MKVNRIEAATVDTRHQRPVDVRIDLTGLAPTIEDEQLLLTIPMHEGPIFDPAFSEFMKQRWGNRGLEVLDRVGDRMFKEQVLLMMGDRF